MTYTVELTATAESSILEQAQYIAIEGQAPENARRWLERVWDAVDSLEHLPRRGVIAPEDKYLPYEVRMLVVGSHLILFTIDDDLRKVVVVGFRHSKRLPRPGDLPTISPDA